MSHEPSMTMQYAVIDEALILESLASDRAAEKNKGNDSKGRGGSGAHGLLGGIRGDGKERGDGERPEDEDMPVFEELETLRLSYQNILRIDNLVGLEALTTLCLDNNVIDEITNLGHLVNLRWLDLSFNNIKTIEGLENLTQLKDLSLYSNQIETLCNLDQCTELECLSVGRNKINKLENLLYLREFKNLHLVTLDGNPVCKDPEYRMYVLAHLEKLKYLDYALIERSEVISAREQYQDELLEAQERENLLEANEKAAAVHKGYLDRLKTAHLEIVETLFVEMFKEDKELPKLKLLPGFDTIYDSYESEFLAVKETTINSGLEIFERYLVENVKMEQAVEKVTQYNEQNSIVVVEAFHTRMKRIEQDIKAFRSRPRQQDITGSSHEDENKEEGVSQDDLLQSLEVLDQDRQKLREELMTIDLQQVQQLKKLNDVFENRAGAIRTERIDHVTQFFRSVEDLENSFGTACEDLAQGLIEQLANNALEDLGDETVAFLSDRDNLMVAIQGAHDIHLGKLLGQEDALREGINKELNGKVKDMKQGISQNNRNRIFEINKMDNESKNAIQALVNEVLGGEDDDIFDGQ